jgi:polysaccharide pyruvyl transferase WcaK-like protein
VAVAARGAKPPTILLRSGWQTVNIGDIAHTPGVLAILERHIPDAQLMLWPVSIDRGAEPMLLRRFPKLKIVKDQAAAFQEADLFLHGSAAGISAAAQMQAWRRDTGKPYGFFGIGFTSSADAVPPASTLDLLNHAAFVFTRETASLANLRAAGIQGPELNFAPDGTFSMDILDEACAHAYLRETGLEPGRFLCVIPRLRYTPYEKIRKVSWSEEEIRRRTAVNDRYAELDHAKLREAVTAWIRRTGGKVLLCPEMTYQLDIIGPLLYDPLPADVKPQVVRRTTYWLPDEASSVYKRAAAVVSCECHSPILAAAQGTPCIYAHQPEDGIKGHMWEDIGLKDWYFEIEESTGEAIARRVLEIHRQPAAARKKVAAAVAYARNIQQERAQFVGRSAG